MWKCNKCGRTFPLTARVSVERRPSTVACTPDITRVVVEKSCCPFCESIEFEEVKEA